MNKKRSSPCAGGICSRFSEIENRFPEFTRPVHSSGVPIAQLKSAIRRAYRGIGGVDLGQVGAQLAKRGSVFRLGRQVDPLVRVGGAVVQFLVAVGVANVAPAFGADCVVVLVKCRDRRVRPSRAWPPQQRHQRMALECRSEEHTSELQSQAYLVCRLRLEKKKTS